MHALLCIYELYLLNFLFLSLLTMCSRLCKPWYIVLFYYYITLTCNICFTVTVTVAQFTRTTTWWHGEVVLCNIYKWSLVSLLQLEEAVDSWGNMGWPRSALRSHCSEHECIRIHWCAAKVTILKGNSRLRDSVKSLIIPVLRFLVIPRHE